MSKLTNLEICKKIADIEGLTYDVVPAWPSDKNSTIFASRGDVELGKFDPIGDGALCFQYLEKYDFDINCYHDKDDKHYFGSIWDNDRDCSIQIPDNKNLNRFICDGVILLSEAHNAKTK